MSSAPTEHQCSPNPTYQYSPSPTTFNGGQHHGSSGKHWIQPLRPSPTYPNALTTNAHQGAYTDALERRAIFAILIRKHPILVNWLCNQPNREHLTPCCCLHLMMAKNSPHDATITRKPPQDPAPLRFLVRMIEVHPMPPRGPPPPGDLKQSPIWLRCQWMLCGTEPLACSTTVPSHNHVQDVEFSSDVSTTRVRRL